MAKKNAVIDTIEISVTEKMVTEVVASIHEVLCDEGLEIKENEIRNNPDVVREIVSRITQEVQDYANECMDLYDMGYSIMMHSKLYKKEIADQRKKIEAEEKAEKVRLEAERKEREQNGVPVVVDAKDAEKARRILIAAGIKLN